MLYTIEEETLNGLADAIRLKSTGQVELPVLSVENQSISFNLAYYYELPSCVKKIKIVGRGEYPTVYMDGAMGLGIAAGGYDGINDTTVRELDNFIVIKEYNPNKDEVSNFDFEIIIEGNCFVFATDYRSMSMSKPYISFEAIGLDENGNEFKYTSLEMIDAVNNLIVVPEEALTITGDCQYRFAKNGWNWFIDTYGNQITTKDISSCQYMFYQNSSIKYIPIVFNCKSRTTLSRMFQGAQGLRELPKIVAPEATEFAHFCSDCYNLREITEENIKDIDFSYAHTYAYSNMSNMFNVCYSLRKIPDLLLSQLYNPATSRNYSILNTGFNGCVALDELLNLPVPRGTCTSNMCSSVVSSCYRLKNFTFAVQEDGTPYTWNAKSQTLDLSSYVGYTQNSAYYIGQILNYNSGITADKQVKDDATYQALKDNPDWFSADINYSRYNHDSAVRTINSLPDTSAYGTNIIKFKGEAGSATDGGAINTLTEEEIAVAAAKGWTVTLV